MSLPEAATDLFRLLIKRTAFHSEQERNDAVALVEKLEGVTREAEAAAAAAAEARQATAVGVAG